MKYIGINRLTGFIKNHYKCVTLTCYSAGIDGRKKAKPYLSFKDVNIETINVIAKIEELTKEFVDDCNKLRKKHLRYKYVHKISTSTDDKLFVMVMFDRNMRSLDKDNLFKFLANGLEKDIYG
jgi:hypothetical protein